MSARTKKTKETPEGLTAERDEQIAAQPPVKAEPRAFTFPKPCVYCGPSVRGVARQYTVYTGEIPAALREFIEKHPAARGLVVSVNSFATARSNLGKSGTAEAILFEKIKSEL